MKDRIQSDQTNFSNGSQGDEHRDLAKGVLINVLGIFARTSKALYFVSVTRLFGKEIFGLYLLAFSVIDLLSKIASLGLEWGILRHASQLIARGRDVEVRSTVFQTLGVAFLSSCIVAFATAQIASLIAIGFMKTPELVFPLRLLCVAMPFITMTTILLYAIRARRKMQYEVYIRSVIEPIVLLVTGLIAFMIYRNVVGVILGQVIASAMSFVGALSFFCKLYPPKPKGLKVSVDWRPLISYSLPMSGMDLLNNFKNRLDLMIIARFLSPGHVGIYGAIIEVVNLIRKVRQIFEPIFQPIVTFLHETAERLELQRHFSLAVRWIASLAFVLFLPIIITPELFLGVFGSEFRTGALALIILAVGQFFYVTLGLSEDVLSMTGHPYVNLTNSAILVTVNVALHLFLIPRYGLVGAAIATGVSLAFISILRMIQTYRFVHIHPFARSLLRPVLAGFLALVLGSVFRISLPERGLIGQMLTVFMVLGTYFFVITKIGFYVEPEDQEISAKIRRTFRRIFSR